MTVIKSSKASNGSRLVAAGTWAGGVSAQFTGVAVSIPTRKRDEAATAGKSSRRGVPRRHDTGGAATWQA
jgi:hypothetical protein